MAATSHLERLSPREQDIVMMVKCNIHLGSMNCNIRMKPYVYGCRPDGINFIDVSKTYEKLMLAARIAATVKNPRDVLVVSERLYGKRAVLKFAQYTEAFAVAAGWTPGQLTNHLQIKYREHSLLIVTDPRTDAQAVSEAAKWNIPIIAFCDTDSRLQYVDDAVPWNNKGKYSVALLWWLLAREVIYFRGQMLRAQRWEVMIDMFFFRAPEELNKIEQATTLAATTIAEPTVVGT